MDKRILKRYLNGQTQRPLLQTSCFKHNNKYLISDSYSMIALNEPNDLNIERDKYMLYNMFDNFTKITEVLKEIKDIPKDTPYIHINKDYDITIDMLKRIKNIIKADKIAVLKNSTPVIKLENTKTNEVGYLLPARRS